MAEAQGAADAGSQKRASATSRPPALVLPGEVEDPEVTLPIVVAPAAVEQAPSQLGAAQVSEERRASRRDGGPATGVLATLEDASGRWPPPAPMLRFKMCMQFSQRFQPSKDKDILKKTNEDIMEQNLEHQAKNVEIKDAMLGWVNFMFRMQIHTENEFDSAFPVVCLTMLDAIYPKRVRWRDVDWRFQYKRTLQKNFDVLEDLWTEVNMEKAREFRVESTPLLLENMITSSVSDRLEFLRLLRRWWDARIHHVQSYNAMRRRWELVSQCKWWGHEIKFPPWMPLEECHVEEETVSSFQRAYDQLPEYRRLIWFLGTPNLQSM